VRQLLVAAAPAADGTVRLDGRDARYLRRVLRLGPGDGFRARYPDGREALLSIERVDGGCLVCRPADREANPAEPDLADAAGIQALDAVRRSAAAPLPPFFLLQALPKGQKMDDIVRQAAEAGVERILPFIAERSVARPGADEAEGKRGRWRRIVKEARQQSGSPVPTEVDPVRDLAGALAAWAEASGGASGGRPVGLLLHQDPLAQGTFHGYLSGDPTAVAVAVGPEGGFAPAETDRFRDAGFRPLIVGANVLRTETAAVFAVAAAQIVLLEKAAWMPHPPAPPVRQAPPASTESNS
jgi:16S rRNA (uracil1498-N3)-methyltransferase